MEQLELQKTYQIRNFYDLLQALREHPEWLEELRTLILTADLIELPKKFDKFVKERFEPLEEKVDRIQEGMEVVKQATVGTERKVEALGQDMGVVKQKVEVLEQDMGVVKQKAEVLEQDMGVVKQKVEVLEQDMGVVKQKAEVLEQDMGVVKQKVEVLEQDIGVVKQKVEVLEQDMGVVKQKVEVLEKDVAWLKKEVKSLKVDVASLKGDNLERKVREKAPAYFGRFFRKIKVIDIQQWAEKLDDAEDQGLITPEEREQALNLDILLRAKKEGRELLLAVEVSYTVEEKDAVRALERANTFYKLYQIETIPVVVGVEISPELEEKHKEVLFIRVVQEQNPS